MRMEARLFQGLAAGNEEAVCSQEDVVEMALLLSSRQVAALEEVANRLGLTSGELLRGVLRRFLQQFPEEVSPPLKSRWGTSRSAAGFR
jgi:hypothetical protein